MFHFGSIAHSVKNAQTCSSPSQLSAGLLTFGVFVAQCCFSHVTEAQGAFAAAVDKQVTVVGVELSRCDHLRQILHVGWFDVHDVWEKVSLRKNSRDSWPQGTSVCLSLDWPPQVYVIIYTVYSLTYSMRNWLYCVLFHVETHSVPK